MDNLEFRTFKEAIENGFMRIGYPRIVEKYKDHNIVIADTSEDGKAGYSFSLSVNGKTFCESVRVWGSDETTLSGHLGAFLPMFNAIEYQAGLEAARRYIDK